ncbi:MAG TPA: LacI family DNA-binding transcriptional regulator [Usitatibacter sp.]|nr:LacI family DNA-binding transcriptional regulator [Usitatibacter sp.]
MSTIKHVAARAGVSFTTVSHVVNRTRPVSDDARLRVERAIAELDYFPSAVARALKTSQTRILGVIVPNITNPFFSELMRGIEDVCERNAYAVFLCNGDDDRDRQGRSLETLLGRRVDGVLLATPTGPAAALAKRLSSAKMKTVIVDRSVPGLDADRVIIDHDAGARIAVEHLLGFGHRKIACLAGPGSFAVSRKRVAGWRKALLRAGVVPRDEWLLEGDFRAAAGHELARKLIARGEVTAIFASNDLLAIGALRAAAEHGVAVPRTLSVIGFDGIEMGAYTYPALTTVGYPIRAIGETAATVLIERIAGTRRRSREIVVEPRIILRESTAPVRRP